MDIPVIFSIYLSKPYFSFITFHHFDLRSINMNSTSTFLITTILAFALLSSITTSAVFATGNLDDEEEEEVLEELQTAVQEIQGTLGTLTLNLTEGSNNIEANCPTTEEIVEEVLENITESQPPVQNVTEPVQNVTEPVQNVTEPQQCPVVQEPEQNNTEVVEEPPQQTILPPAEAVEEQNQTGCNPIPEEPQQNTTEIIEEVIENVTDIPNVECNIVQEEEQQQPQTNQSVIPGIVLPNITEPVEPVTPVQNETQNCNPVPEPVQENETVSELEPIYCPINGELLGYTNTTSGEQLPISAGQQVEQPQEQPTIVPEQSSNQTTVQDEQEIASIEFEAQCGCFVVDKTPEDLESNGGGSVEQSLYNQ